MNITTDNPERSLDDSVLVNRHRCSFALALTTMRGEIRPVAGSISLGIPNDRGSLPEHPTLRDLVMLVLKRQHPVLQYVAEQNGVCVEGYYEHPVTGRLWTIEYNDDGEACRLTHNNPTPGGNYPALSNEQPGRL